MVETWEAVAGLKDVAVVLVKREQHGNKQWGVVLNSAGYTITQLLCDECAARTMFDLVTMDCTLYKIEPTPTALIRKCAEEQL